ncbi:Transcription elongation factor b polypeptide 1, partial [Globisporangium splendens]
MAQETQDAAATALDMIKLISAEGHEIYISRKCAMVSGTIRAMLSGQFTESKGEITFPDISAPILEKVSQYMYYKTQYTDSTSRFPDFVIEPEIAMELLMAANYLDC